MLSNILVDRQKKHAAGICIPKFLKTIPKYFIRYLYFFCRVQPASVPSDVIVFSIPVIQNGVIDNAYLQLIELLIPDLNWYPGNKRHDDREKTD